MVLSYQEAYVLQTLPFRVHIFFTAGTILTLRVLKMIIEIEMFYVWNISLPKGLFT